MMYPRVASSFLGLACLLGACADADLELPVELLPWLDGGSYTPPDASLFDAAGGGPNWSAPHAGLADAAAADAGALDGDLGSSPEGGPSVPDASRVPLDPALCKLKPSQVAVLGDSYIALSYGNLLLKPFTDELQKNARGAGALGAKESYRDYSISGAAMAPGPLALIRSIPGQYDDAHAAEPDIKLVIMDGGGNDVLVDKRECLNFKSVEEVAQSSECTAVIDRALEAAGKMYDKAKSHGVQRVIYFFYPHLPKNSLFGGPGPNYILDYAYPRVREFCEERQECLFVDTRPAFDDGTWSGKDDGSGTAKEGLIEFDGIHPTPAGSKILADLVWDVMQDNCLASQ